MINITHHQDVMGRRGRRVLDLRPVPRIIGGGGLDYDYLFVGQTKVTPPAKTTNFLKVTLGANPTASWVAAMPETQEANSVVFDVTKNRIYIHGAFGGG